MGNDTTIQIHAHAHMILEHMPVRVALYDAQNLCLLDASTSYLQALDRFLKPEMCAGKVIGHSMTEWDTEIQGPDFATIFHQVAASGLPYHGEEIPIVTQEGKITYWNFTIDPIPDVTGRIAFLLQTSTEVTGAVQERLKAEQAQAALKEANQELKLEYRWLEVVEIIAGSIREALDISFIGEVAADAIATYFSPLGVCLHIADPETQTLHLLSLYTSQNYKELAAALRYFPYERMALTRRLPYYDEPVIISDLQKEGMLNTLRLNDIPLNSSTRGFICVPLWFRDHFEGALTAFFDYAIEAHGPEIKALKASSTHIASALSQARLHAAVENERMYLHALLEQLPEGIMIIETATGCINYANPAASRLLGVPQTNMINTPVHRHPSTRLPHPARFYSRSIPPWNFAIVRALSGEQLNSEETFIAQPDGSVIIALMSSALLRTRSAKGVVQEIAIVFQDVTVQKSLEEHKNEFFSVINHELRTPLTIIQGYAEMLQFHVKQEKLLDPFITTATTNITEQSEQLTRLIEDMLNISRIEHAQFIMQHAPHDLLSTIVRVVESQIVTSKRSITLHLDGLQKTDALMAVFDEERIIQVLHNLINNAVKYSPSDTPIEVSVHYSPTRNQTVLIQVKDQGIGIASSELPHIFKRFHRASTLSSSINGFGIGLYLAKEIITRHGGHIWVESTEGVGSTFSIELLLNAPQP